MHLRYRAGPRAQRTLREHGLSAATLRALIAPAAGPKWLVVAGLDRALLGSPLLRDRGEPLLLLGASAGAWRAMALSARHPAACHRALAEGYVGQRFERGVDARTVSAAYRVLLANVFPDDDVAHALAHRDLELALIAVRTRCTTGSERRTLQTTTLGLAAALNLLTPRSRELFFERTLFTRGTATPHRMLSQLAGTRAALTPDNAREALLASGTVPLYMAPVRDIAGAPSGRYMDGGLTDYHVNQPVTTGGDGVALLMLHQSRIVPNWFDKLVPLRAARPAWLQDLLLVYPDERWVASLPGGQIPTREDFETFVDAPEERIARWQEAVARSEQLGEQLLEDLERGRLPDLVEPL